MKINRLIFIFGFILLIFAFSINTFYYINELKYLDSGPIYEETGWFVSPNDVFYYEIEENITHSEILKAIYEEYKLNETENCAFSNAKKILISQVPDEINISFIAESIISFSGPVEVIVDEHVPEIVIPLALPVGFWQEIASEINKTGTLIAFSFSWPHDYLYKFKASINGTSFYVEAYWDTKYGFLDAIILKDENEALILRLCSYNTLKQPAKIIEHDPSNLVIIGIILIAIIAVFPRLIIDEMKILRILYLKMYLILHFISIGAGIVLAYTLWYSSVEMSYMANYAFFNILTFIIISLMPLFTEKQLGGEKRLMIVLPFLSLIAAASAIGSALFGFDCPVSHSSFSILASIAFGIFCVIITTFAIVKWYKLTLLLKASESLQK